MEQYSANIGRTNLCVGRLSDWTTRSSAPLHAERRAERALPLPVGARKKSVTVKNLHALQISYRRATTRTLAACTHTDRVSARHDRFFYTGGLRAAGWPHNVRRRAMSQNERFVTGDECPKNATSPLRAHRPFAFRDRPFDFFFEFFFFIFPTFTLWHIIDILIIM